MKKLLVTIIASVFVFCITAPAIAGDVQVKLSDLDKSLESLEKTKYNIFLTAKDVKDMIKKDKKLEGIIKEGTPVVYKYTKNAKYDNIFKKTAILYASIVWAKYLISEANKDIDEYEKDGKGWTMLKELKTKMANIKTVLDNQIKEAPQIVTSVQSLVKSPPSPNDFSKKIMGKSIPDPIAFKDAGLGLKKSAELSVKSANDIPGVASDFAKLVTRFASLKGE
ncbi:MAG: hypothetical protein JXA60_07575 [Candidatus Coatesbacteria bacterium]|nr:hypothetical protein [Candidatus Coatesbacteria bacterium]